MCERFNSDEFCHLCARYVKIDHRIEITNEFQEMYYDIYGEEMNLDGDAPSIVCEECFDSISQFAIGEIDYLRVTKPARWGESRGDHRDCFYHLVKVNFENCKTIFPAKEWSVAFRPPEFA